MDDRQNRPSLKERDADQIRNEQRGGAAIPDDRAGAPEPNDTLVWSDPGGEAYNYRNALVGAGGKADPGPKQEMGGLMYGRCFEDPDGHHWEPMWMAPQMAEQGAHSVECATAATADLR